MEFGETLADF